MKNIQIGKLIFTKKAILTLAFCLFINGISLGALITFNKNNEGNNTFLLFYFSLFIPYILLYKTIKKNIIEIK